MHFSGFQSGAGIQLLALKRIAALMEGYWSAIET
jgi:hypothetical protein